MYIYFYILYTNTCTYKDIIYHIIIYAFAFRILVSFRNKLGHFMIMIPIAPHN